MADTELSFWFMCSGTLATAFLLVMDGVLLEAHQSNLGIFRSGDCQGGILHRIYYFCSQLCPFGLDKMPDPSGEQITAFIHWCSEIFPNCPTNEAVISNYLEILNITENNAGVYTCNATVVTLVPVDHVENGLWNITTITGTSGQCSLELQQVRYRSLFRTAHISQTFGILKSFVSAALLTLVLCSTFLLRGWLTIEPNGPIH